jgi:hypothetical protein
MFLVKLEGIILGRGKVSISILRFGFFKPCGQPESCLLLQAGLCSAPPSSAVREVDLSALADKLFQPREHMPRSGSMTSATLQAATSASDAPQPNGAPSRRQSARRDVIGATNQGLTAGGDGQGSREQIENEEVGASFWIFCFHARAFCESNLVGRGRCYVGIFLVMDSFLLQI